VRRQGLGASGDRGFYPTRLDVVEAQLAADAHPAHGLLEFMEHAGPKLDAMAELMGDHPPLTLGAGRAAIGAITPFPARGATPGGQVDAGAADPAAARHHLGLEQRGAVDVHDPARSELRAGVAVGDDVELVIVGVADEVRWSDSKVYATKREIDAARGTQLDSAALCSSMKVLSRSAPTRRLRSMYVCKGVGLSYGGERRWLLLRSA
jgi:hypothetical protein